LSPAVTLTGPAFAEVLVADDAVRVDEVQRRPVAVGERAPDLVGDVDRDRVVDLALLGRLPTPYGQLLLCAKTLTCSLSGESGSAARS
jgi:hypothetical protein